MSVDSLSILLFILRPDKRRWAVLSEVQPLDKYIWKSASQVALFTYSPICETLHTKSIYLYSYGCRIVENKRFELLKMNLISPDTLFEIYTYM